MQSEKPHNLHFKVKYFAPRPQIVPEVTFLKLQLSPKAAEYAE